MNTFPLSFPPEFTFKYTTKQPRFPWEYVWFIVAAFLLGALIRSLVG